MVTINSTISFHHYINVTITGLGDGNSFDNSLSFNDIPDISIISATPWTLLDIYNWKNGPFAYQINGCHRRLNSNATEAVSQRPACHFYIRYFD